MSCNFTFSNIAMEKVSSLRQKIGGSEEEAIEKAIFMMSFLASLTDVNGVISVEDSHGNPGKVNLITGRWEFN